jgi:aryl-alcohol dehydrogenase-like predicted oxidoreductase
MRSLALQGTMLSSSRLGFGLSGLHHLRRSRDRQSLLSAAVDGGIRYFDTSPFYGHGLAERELGAFAQGRRDQLLIATKFGIPPDQWLSRFPALMYTRLAANAILRRVTRKSSFVIAKQYDYGAAAAVSSLNRSLRALRTDHVDILYLHDPTLARLSEPEPVLDALRGLQSAGKIRYFGLAGHPSDCVAIRNGHPGLAQVLQVDASGGTEDIVELNRQSIPFHSTYGHFRSREAGVRDALLAAIGVNREGVILFSTRRSSRIDAMIRLLDTVEPG